jgi:hypothetical protein
MVNLYNAAKVSETEACNSYFSLIFLLSLNNEAHLHKNCLDNNLPGDRKRRYKKLTI